MNETIDPAMLKALEEGPVYRFSDWPNPAVPKVTAGVYTIWDGRLFIYPGMAGRGLDADSLLKLRAGKKVTGLFDRLRSHATGRRSGDQFCVYVQDRFILPTLTKEDLLSVGRGALNLDELVRRYIRTRLS